MEYPPFPTSLISSVWASFFFHSSCITTLHRCHSQVPGHGNSMHWTRHPSSLQCIHSCFKSSANQLSNYVACSACRRDVVRIFGDRTFTHKGTTLPSPCFACTTLQTSMMAPNSAFVALICHAEQGVRIIQFGRRMAKFSLKTCADTYDRPSTKIFTPGTGHSRMNTMLHRCTRVTFCTVSGTDITEDYLPMYSHKNFILTHLWFIRTKIWHTPSFPNFLSRLPWNAPINVNTL